MARSSGKKDDLIKCEYCGEMYSTTYKHCPFCNEDGTSDWAEPEEELEEVRPTGGKRLAAGSGGGYYDPPQKSSPSRGSGRGGKGRRNMNISPWSILGVILSLALIIAAVCIVVSIFRSITGRGPKPTPTPTPPTIESKTPTPTPTPTDELDPTPSVEPTPQANKPTSFTLNASDLSFFNPGELYDLKVKLVPADAEMPEVTWTSSDPNVASVSWNGRVTAISKGTVTITASIEGLGEQSCIFRCRFEGTAPSTSGSGNANSSGLTLSREDFTLEVGESWRLTVSGTESTVTWSSSNESVAKVSSNGTVTNVGKGTCTVTATVDGVTLKCIVRCK